MSEFKVGDRVRRIAGRETPRMHKGGMYVVSKVNPGLIGLHGVSGLWYPENFKPVRATLPDLLAQDEPDVVNRPAHYNSHPSGVECITITEHMNFNLGNAIKYIWRADLKNDAIEDLKKAAFYVSREIQRRESKS